MSNTHPADKAFYNALNALRGNVELAEDALTEAEKALGAARIQLTKALENGTSHDDRLRLEKFKKRAQYDSTEKLLTDYARGTDEPLFVDQLTMLLGQRGVSLKAFEADLAALINKHASKTEQKNAA